MTAKQVFEALARLPARVWLQGALALIGFIVLAVLGFAVIAAVALIGLVVILVFKARAWFAALFAGRQPPQAPAEQRASRQVTDVSYEIVDKPKDDRRRADLALYADDLARIHQIVGIERALDRAHDVELDLAAVVLEVLDLEAADAVLGGDRAAMPVTRS